MKLFTFGDFIPMFLFILIFAGFLQKLLQNTGIDFNILQH